MRFCKLCVVLVMLCVFVPVYGISSLMNNPGFESGNFAGWVTDWNPGLNVPGQVLSWGSAPNQRYCVLIGTGIIPGGTGSWTNGIEQTITMPIDTFAEWSFWVDTGQVTLSGIYGSSNVGFMASVEGDSKIIEFHIWAQMNYLGQRYWHVEYPSGWDVQQYDWWKSFEVTSDNLLDHFSPGESVTLRYQTTISQSGSNMNRMIPLIDNQPPDGSSPVAFTSDVLLEELPNNDRCNKAISVQCYVPCMGTTEFSSSETAISSCGQGDNYCSWYSFTPSITNEYVINLCDSSFDTVLSVYGFCGGPELACDDDSCGNQSKLLMEMDAGQTYYIRISGRNNSTGAYVLRIYDVECTQEILSDLNNDCKVDFSDLAIFVSEWLECNLDPSEECFN